GHGVETATRGLDVAVEETAAKAQPDANEQSLRAAVEDLAAVAAKVKDIDIHAEMWTVLQEVGSGRPASDVLFGQLAGRMPAALVKRVDRLAAVAAMALGRLVAALREGIQSVAGKHAELERIRSEQWFGFLP